MHTPPPSLLQRLRHTDEAAWAEFVKLYTPLLYSWAQRVGLQGPDAADLVQDVFVILVQQLPSFTYDRHKSFRAWLRTVTLNKWRNRRRVKRPILDSGAVLDSAVLPDSAETFWDEEYRQHLLGHALQFVRAELPADTWTAFEQYAIQGRRAAEVALELHISVNMVYLAKSRVLTRLRQELEGLLD